MGAANDYLGEDGLMMCGNCHAPKQFRIDVPGDWFGRLVPVACECEKDAQKKEQEAIKRMQLMKEIQEYKKRGLADAQYRESTFDLDDRADEKASNQCRMYVEHWPEMQENNFGMMLWGDVGGGKTFFASCIANAILDKGIPVLMTTIPALSGAMAENFGCNKIKILETVKTIPLLVLDDFGMERNTPTIMEHTYEIINARYKAKKPLIITTNLSMRVIKETTEINYRRIYSRVTQMCVPVFVEASMRRQQAAKKNYETMQRIFAKE